MVDSFFLFYHYAMKIGLTRKRLFRSAVFIGVLAGSVFSSSGAFASVVLNQSNFYSQISEDVVSNLNGSYVLGSDIDISRVVRTDDGSGGIVESAPTGTSVFGTFAGNIDGANKKISGLATPLFDIVSGEVKDMYLEAETLGGVVGGGALANTLDSSGTVSNVTVTGNVSGDLFTGGLVGYSNGTIVDSTVHGDVTGTSQVGGLVGNSNGTITNSNTTGDVTGVGQVGGLVGLSFGSITNSHATGDVTGGEQVGGLVGYGYGANVTNSSATGEITGSNQVGGLVGYGYGANVTSSHATGSVSGASGSIGGLIGQFSGDVINSYAVGDVSGVAGYVGGLIGYLEGNVSGSHSQNSVTSGGDYVGGLVGYVSGNVSDSFAKTTISSSNVSNRVGGLVGHALGSISNSYAVVSGNIDSNSDAGGLAGRTDSSITGSYALVTGDVFGSSGSVGGLAGLAYGSVTNSFSIVNGNIVGSSDYVGGLLGRGMGSITNSYSSVGGNVSGTSHVGGLSGEALGQVSDSAAIVKQKIVGTSGFIGGLLGKSGTGVTSAHSIVNGGIEGQTSVGGLIGYSLGNVTNSHSKIDNSILATGEYIGGLIGNSSGTIDRSTARIAGNVQGLMSYIGGLVGGSNTGDITNSYALITENLLSTGGSAVGGLIGFSAGGIDNSYTHIGGNVSSPGSYSGGLTGDARGAISNSFAKIHGNVTAGSEYTGGLVGDSWGRITNSHADVKGSLEATSYVGGLAGRTRMEVSNSHARITSDVIANGLGYVGGLIGSAAENVTGSSVFVGGIVKGDALTGALIGRLESNSRVIQDSHSSISEVLIRQGAPILVLIGTTPVITIENSYFTIAGNSYPVLPAEGSVLWTDLVFELISSTPSIIYTQDYEWSIDPLPLFLDLPTFPNLLDTLNHSTSPEIFGTNICLNNGRPFLIASSNSFTNTCASEENNRPKRERDLREIVEVRVPAKIEKTLGFKSQSPLPTSAPISFIKSTEKFDIAKVKVVEIASTANVRVSAKSGEALQISLKSESKEPVELWVKSPDGTWLLAGVITFDKNGKAVLPPLQFKSAGDFTLVLSKPTADSAKGSAPMNQTGSLLVEVI